MAATKAKKENSNANTVAKPRGKPFAKGADERRTGQFTGKNDPRNNTNGQRSAAAVNFSRTLRELIVATGEEAKEVFDKNGRFLGKKKNVEWLVDRVWSEAHKGEQWAVNFIADRVEGKSAQQIDLTNSDGSMTPTAVQIIPYVRNDSDSD